MTEKLLTDRIILITGAAAGIGRATSLACAEQGATVILLDKDLPATEKVYDEIESAGGPTPAIYPLNLEGATEHDYGEMAETLNENFGQLHGIIHNAAICPYLRRTIDWEPEDWRRVMQVNLTGPFLLTQALLPLMMSVDKASLLFVSDKVGTKGQAFWGAYCASKFALEGFAQSLADEFEQSNIHVATFDPGPTQTEFRKDLYPGEDASERQDPTAVAKKLMALLKL